jgi:hypothetical protein
LSSDNPRDFVIMRFIKILKDIS